MKNTVVLLVCCLLVFLAACSSAPEKPQPIPLTEEEIAFLKKLDDPETYSLVQEVPYLFPTLINLLTAWLDSALSQDDPKDARISSNLKDILSRRVYVNFETILEQLDTGPPPNRIIAAAALGFSRIPESEKFPQVYPRAVEALVGVLDCGDDAIVENALLGLYILADESTPLDKILDIMVQHHEPNVRANAALAIQAVASPRVGEKILPYVLPGLKDEEPKVRNHCVLIAAELDNKSTLSALIELLDDQYALIQANAAKALGRMGNKHTCVYLIPLLLSQYPIVREHTLQSLRVLSGKDYGFEVEDWQEWWKDNQGS